MATRLFTSFYEETRDSRRQEYLTCLGRNLSCGAIDSVHVLVEGGEKYLPHHTGLVTRPIAHRPLYADFFAWANELAAPDDITVIANSDIYFDGSLAAVPLLLSPDACYALSRWDVREDGASRLFDRNDSQDAWIFRGRIRGNLVADFPLGVPRCDNRLLHELRAAGYEVTNPAFSIRSHHLHRHRKGAVDYPDAPGEVPRPYAYAFPANVSSLPRILLHNSLHPDHRLGWRFDRRRASQGLFARVLRRIRNLLQRKRDAKSPGHHESVEPGQETR